MIIICHITEGAGAGSFQFFFPFPLPPEGNKVQKNSESCRKEEVQRNKGMRRGNECGAKVSVELNPNPSWSEDYLSDLG